MFLGPGPRQAIISVNYPMTIVPGAKGAHTAFNGATRQIPGTQNSRQPIPKEDEECASQQSGCIQLFAHNPLKMC